MNHGWPKDARGVKEARGSFKEEICKEEKGFLLNTRNTPIRSNL